MLNLILSCALDQDLIDNELLKKRWQASGMGQQKARYFHLIIFIGINYKIIANRVLIKSRAWRDIPSLSP